MVESIKKVTCDRCGAECSHFIEKIVTLKSADNEKVTEKKFTNNRYVYTEVTMQGQNSGMTYEKERFDLCGKCMSELCEWLLKKEGRC